LRPSSARRWRRAVLLFVAATAIAARPANAQDVACGDPDDVEVRRLEFTGNDAFPDRVLADGVVNTSSSWLRRTIRFAGARRCLDREQMPLDSLRLLLFYRKHGFPAVTVGTELRPVGRTAIELTFRINEGPPLLIDQFEVAGLDSVAERARIARDLPAFAGGRFDQYAVEATRDTIARRLRDNGYPRAEVLRSFVTDTIDRRASVRFDVEPGPRSRIGTITVRHDARSPGEPARVDEANIRRLLGVEPGDLYRERELEQAKRALYLSDAFRYVDVSVDTSRLDAADSLVSVNVTTAEGFLRSTRAGVGWATLDCFRAQAQFADYNFLDGLNRFDLNARVSKIGIGHPVDGFESLCQRSVRDDPYSDTLNYYVGATLRQGRLFGLRTLPALTLYSERRSEYKAFLRSTPIGALLSLDREWWAGYPVTLGYTLEYGRTEAQPAIFCAVFNVCEQQARDILRSSKRYAVASASITRGRANDAVNPTHGTLLRLDVRHASAMIGSDPDLQFNKGVLDGAVYRSVGSSVLVGRLRMGAVVGSNLSLSDEIPFVPLQERLYAGGQSTVRGFRQNELGDAVYIVAGYDTVPAPIPDRYYFRTAGSDSARAPQRTVPSGGNAMIVANLELRTRSPVFPDLVQLAFFADAGQVWTRGRGGSGFDPVNLRVTPGVGVRVFSPVGPIRVDVGFNPYLRDQGAAYFDAPVGAGDGGASPLYCVSPGNTLLVTLPDPDGPAPAVQEPGNCRSSFRPPTSRNFFRQLTFNFAIGQAF
jgi:outer membrane protein insertion porin family/translocation and assembly module TamA